MIFRADQKNKMAAPASDWLRHFRLLCFCPYSVTFKVTSASIIYPKVCSPSLLLDKLFKATRLFVKTRAPRGTDRSPEYNEHFCYQLDSRVKNLTTEWNQKQQHFITHASRSLLWIWFVAVAFRSEEVFWRRGTPPPPWHILPCPGSAPGQIWPKHLYACAGPWALHPYQVS